jgi:hypothetical protein
MTPPAGTPAPRVPPTPAPWSKTPRPPSVSQTRPPVEEQMVRGVALARTTLVGLCLITFSCGIMCTVAVDRFWPRARAECGGMAAGNVAAALPVQAVPVREAAPPATRGVEVMLRPSPAQPPPAAAHPRPATAPAAAPAPPPAARAVAPKSPAPNAASAKGRTPARKRTASPPSPAAPDNMLPPTGIWIDPFTQ